MKVLEHVYVEQAPGDALFFHANLLHTSGQNKSDKSRNVLLCCYNAARNSPFQGGRNAPALHEARQAAGLGGAPSAARRGRRRQVQRAAAPRPEAARLI